MSLGLRSIVLVAGWLLVLALIPAGPAAAQEIEIDARTCICEVGKGACQHKLGNPKKIPIDPCWCPKCRLTERHPGKQVPFGWNPVCYRNNRMDCYLKRHAAAWHITCSTCIGNEKCCDAPKSENCPDCLDGETDPLATDATGKGAAQRVLQRLEREREFFERPKKLTVLYTKHFYMVTDVDRVKVRTMDGAPRVMRHHEWAHLMMERAEHAYRDYVTYFGAPDMRKPCAIYIPAREKDQRKLSSVNLRSEGVTIMPGGDDRNGPSEGFCLNGCAPSLEKYDNDHMITMAMRHMLGHLFISTWGGRINASNRVLPRWVDVGVAHWLSRLPERFREDATICEFERDYKAPGGSRSRGGGGRSGAAKFTGKDWHKHLLKMARDPKLDPIEKLLGKTAVNQLTKADHERAWSWFDYCLAEWREPFVAMLRDLREEKEVRDAFVTRMKCTPEAFDERWKERVLGKRGSIGPVPDDASGSHDAPGAREREALLAEQDMETLAARVRALGTVDEAETIDVVIDLLARKSQLVRSTVMVALLKTTDPAVHERIWKYGLAHENAMARAHTARACGLLELKAALPGLQRQLEDSNWFARAEAALACGSMKHIAAMAGMRTMLQDSSEKARIAAMDSLAMFGEDAFRAVPRIVPHLKAGRWQLRVTAAHALGGIGSMEAVEDLITRMELETGRVREEIYDALKKITRDDLTRNPAHWRAWWERLEDQNPGRLPGRPAPVTGGREDDGPDPNARYAETEYYGIHLYSSRIGYVLDTSLSMKVNFEPHPSAAAALSRTYTGENKLTICKEEIAQSLGEIDPRAHFSIITFGSRVRSFKRNPVRATRSNIESAEAFVKGLPPSGETNYYDALRAVLDIDDAPDTRPNLRDTPDTVTFLTDGTPTKGSITEPDTLLEWYTGLNRYARIRTHVICFGNTGVDFKLLRALAGQNDGTYVQVKSKDVKGGK